MSDPVSNLEIEDVLSSIRRLVSSDDRAAQSKLRGAEETQDGDADDNKLVLTPSLRIDNIAAHPETDADDQAEGADESGSKAEVHLFKSVDGDADDSPADEQAPADDADLQVPVTVTSEDPAPDKAMDLRDVTSPTADTLDDQTADDDPRDIEVHDADAIDAFVVKFKSERSDTDRKANSVASNDPEDIWRVPNADEDDTESDIETEGAADGDEPVAATDTEAADAVKDRDRGGLEARVAVFEDVIAARDDQWEPDGESSDAYSGGPVAPLPWHEQVPDETGAPAEPPESADVSEDVASETEDGSEMPEDAADTADIEARDSPKSDHSEPDSGEPESVDAQHDDGDTQPADTAEPGDFEDPVRQAQFEAGGDDAPEAADELDENVPALSLEETGIDEEALRDVVAEIVRQELQGALGERITRNVRKLVRREIHRALASQDLQ